MAGLPDLVVRQPRPFDLVDDPVKVCGIGTGFEAVFSARVRDGDGKELNRISVHAGGTGVWGNFQVQINLKVTPVTAQGTLEVFESSEKDGSEGEKVVVPVTFGAALIEGFYGFAQYTVKRGDTLSGIARRFYDDAGKFSVLFEANRDQLHDPSLISPGQVLRVPQSVGPLGAPRTGRRAGSVKAG